MKKNRKKALVNLGLTDQESKQVLKKSGTYSFPESAIILEKGNPSDDLYLVLEGRAKAVEIDAHGEEQVLSYFVPGDHFGWTGLEDRTLGTSIMTAEPSRFLVFPKQELKSSLFSNPSTEPVAGKNRKQTGKKDLELSEVVQQKMAISEILRAISASPTDVKSILETVAENAARLCHASDSEIFQIEDDGPGRADWP